MAVYEVAGDESIFGTAMSMIRGGKNIFVIDMDNDLFYIPYNKKPFSKLSDIDKITYSSEEHTGLMGKDLHVSHNLKVTGILFGERIFDFGKRKDNCEQLQLILEKVVQERKDNESKRKEVIKSNLFDKSNTKIEVYEVAGNENISNIFSKLGKESSTFFEDFKNSIMLPAFVVATIFSILIYNTNTDYGKSPLVRTLALLAVIIVLIYYAKRIIQVVISIVNGGKNIFTIDVGNDLFYIPYNKAFFCKLSDINNVVSLPEKHAADLISRKPYIAHNLKIIGSTFGEKTLYFGKLKDACNELKLVLEVVIEQRQESSQVRNQIPE